MIYLKIDSVAFGNIFVTFMRRCVYVSKISYFRLLYTYFNFLTKNFKYFNFSVLCICADYITDNL